MVVNVVLMFICVMNFGVCGEVELSVYVIVVVIIVSELFGYLDVI